MTNQIKIQLGSIRVEARNRKFSDERDLNGLVRVRILAVRHRREHCQFRI
jgi:hypothetical protein